MTHSARYTPGTDSIDITAPGGLAALLDFHRANFGDARMEADADAVVVIEGAQLNEHGFPDKTPWKDMPAEQQAAYWKHQARKHEERASRSADYDDVVAERDRLRQATLSDSEKAIEAARTEAADAARAEVRKETLPNLVKAEFKAAVAGRIPADRLSALIEPLDLTKFLTADGGEVDTDKVQRYVDGIAPADAKKWPDTGQGHRTSTKTSGVGAGRDLYESRRPKK